MDHIELPAPNPPVFKLLLTKEQVEQIKDKELKLFTSEGQSVFEIRAGNIPTNKYIIYIMFV